MGNSTGKETNDVGTASGSSTIDNRTKEISKKVWDLESQKPSLLKVNSNGTLPLNIQKSMKNNEFKITDHVDSTNKRTAYLKVNGLIKKFQFTEV